jgi:hypothetical protein
MRPIVRRSVLAAALAASALEALGAEDIGTLFTTPEERARLDRLRRGESTAAALPDGRAARHKPTLTGYVQRSDGRNTVWIDGRPVALAGPGARPLEPGMVQPRASEPVLRADEPDKDER